MALVAFAVLLRVLHICMKFVVICYLNYSLWKTFHSEMQETSGHASERSWAFFLLRRKNNWVRNEIIVYRNVKPSSCTSCIPSIKCCVIGTISVRVCVRVCVCVCACVAGSGAGASKMIYFTNISPSHCSFELL